MVNPAYYICIYILYIILMLTYFPWLYMAFSINLFVFNKVTSWEDGLLEC